MPSTIAKIRMIADSTKFSLWGSNPQEESDIEMIRKEFAEYLFTPAEKIPTAVIKRLGPVAIQITDTLTDWDMIIRMYEDA